MTSEEPLYLAGRIQRQLAEHPDTAELGVRVTVHGDAVYLAGDVASEQRRQRITEVVRELVGERTVHDEMAVTCADAPAVSEELR